MSRIFLSSTLSDLVLHRQAVRDAIRQLGATDISMEHFGAREERPAEECVRVVSNESDVFVGIYAHRYGFVPDGGETSVCELEYKAACDATLPRFIYLIDDNHPWLPVHIDDGAARGRLKAFKEMLCKRHICQTFTSEHQLATRVVADVGRHMAMQATPKVKPGIRATEIMAESSQVHEEFGAEEWNQRRKDVYKRNRKLFLTHVAHPSAKPGQEVDVFIYLIRHKSEDYSDVSEAEFFLGPYWGNKVFTATERNGFIGIATAAYGTFLCVCRVTFKDGSQIYLERYIDFETQKTGRTGA
jgi:hypothetical protein